MPAGDSDEAIWNAFLHEIEWLYGQMNRPLRAVFTPVFVLFELKTIVLCLRSCAAQQRAEIDRLLRHSLLAGRLQAALRQEAEVRGGVAAMAEAFGPLMGDVRTLEDAYAGGGIRGFETRLVHGYLGSLAAARLHPAIAAFFVAFIDLRNLMTLYKHLRWGIDDPAAFIAGGSLERPRLRQASASQDPASLDALVRGVAGRAAPPLAASEGALETVLLGSLALNLHKSAAEGEPPALILDYAWRVYVHARNLAVLLHAGGLEAGLLDRELIA